MRYVNVISILVLVFLLGCKQYEFETEAEDEAKVAETAAGVAAQKVAEAVSKVTGKGVEEVKALSKEDLEKLSEEVKKDSEKSRDRAREGKDANDKAKRAELVKVVKSSAEKFEKAFKTLVSEGYGSDNGAAEVIKGNMKPALEKLGLVDKLAEIANGSGSNDNQQKKASMKKAVEEFGSGTGTCSSDISKNGNSLDNGSKKCMKNLLSNVEHSFNGVEKNIRDELELEKPSEKFKKSLQSLVQAASDLSSAAGLIAALFS